MMSTEEYLKYSNEEKLTIIQIEDIEGLRDIEEIASLDGIDMLFFGPAAFSQSVGKADNIWNETTLAARKKVAETARKHHKFAGTVGSPDNLKELYDMGFRFVSLDADVCILGEGWTKIMDQVKNIKF